MVIFSPEAGLVRRRFWCLAAILLTLSSGPAADRPADHLQQAAELIERGDLDGAERSAQLALNEPSSRAAASSILGTIRVYQKRLAEAKELLETAIQLDPRLVGAHLNLGHVHILEGNPERAKADFREVLQIDPNNSNARLSLAQLEADTGNYSAALELAKPLKESLRGSPAGLYLLATTYLGLGQEAEARILLADWMRLPQVPLELTLGYSRLLLKNGLPQDAVGVLEKARKESPDSFEAITGLAEAYWASGDLKGAAEAYELAASRNPACAECLLNLGRLAERENETEKALAYLIRAKRLAPDNPEILFAFGRVCLKRNLFRDALPALEQAVRMRPDEDRFTYVLASGYVGKTRYTEAIALFQGLLDRKPEDPVLNYALGSVLYTEGKNYADAEKHLRKSIRLQPAQVGAYYYLGMVVMRTGGQDQAEEIFAELLRRYPEHIPSLEQLSIIQVRKRNYDAAGQLLERLLRLDPDSLTGHYQTSLLLGRLGQKKEAEKHLQIAKRLEAEEKKASKTELYLLTPH
jgi:tetratricopeptide (TPR) repeat protein